LDLHPRDAVFIVSPKSVKTPVGPIKGTSMYYRPLGKTGLKISAVSLGTVELGMDYGIRAPGEFGKPQRDDSLRLLRDAFESGINLFDTAPTYGCSERLLGEALGDRRDCLFATKVPIPKGANGERLRGKVLRNSVRDSVEASLCALRREVIDVVQIHNATTAVIEEGEICEAFLELRRQGKVRFFGVSVYTEAEALVAVQFGCFELLQVPYNLLDRRMEKSVFAAAAAADVSIVARSVFLKGALTNRVQWLPEELAPLRQAADQTRAALNASWQNLPELALSFCLLSPGITSILVGVRTRDELTQAVDSATAGPLPQELLDRTAVSTLTEEWLANPVNWAVP
jgi:aryl-alcohol dehydrogenase-like predicted oxidoreductase